MIPLADFSALEIKMERRSFPPLPHSAIDRGGSIASAARDAKMHMVWNTQAAMKATGLGKEQTFALGAKAIGRQFTDLWELSIVELKEIVAAMGEVE